MVFFTLLMQQYAGLFGVTELIQHVPMLLLNGAVPTLLKRLAHVQLSQPLRVNVINQAEGGE